MLFNFILAFVHILDLVTICYMVFKERRTGTSIIAWTLILILMPFLGFVIYLFIGRKIGKPNMYVFNKDEFKVFKYYLKENEKNVKVYSNNKHSDMIRAFTELDYSPYRENNHVSLYSDGEVFFNELLSEIKGAKKSINIQFYIFRTDRVGTEILNALIEKAKEGVKVNFLFDSIGSKSLKKSTLNELVKVGGEYAVFFPSWLKVININMNFRNHRKVVVIDNRIGFIGGFNIGDEYRYKSKKYGYWRDTHIKIEGSAVLDLNIRFLVDWKYASKKDIDIKSSLIVNNNYIYGNDAIQILASGPNEDNRFEIKLGYLKMIQKAKRYLFIQSPYFILDSSIYDSIKLASLSGVDVRIMVPGKGDHPFVYWANLSYVGKLLPYGVKIYHYNKEDFLHAKTIVIDDEVCSIGTANMDIRSFELNFEINAFIYSSHVSILQRNEFLKDISNSKELTLNEYNKRGEWVKFKESFSQLFSSLL